MKKSSFSFLILFIASLILCNGCQRATYDDETSIGNYKRAKERLLWGAEETVAVQDDSFSLEEEFIPLEDEDLKQQFAEAVFKQPKEEPGEDFSSIPTIDGFSTPSGGLASIFRLVHFNTDEHCLRNPVDQTTIEQIANHLKQNKKTYIFVEGHCDQRASESYNLALGTRRANAIRSLLIQKGANPEQIYTVSYGKEKLMAPENNPTAWAQNRRAAFRIYTKR